MIFLISLALALLFTVFFRKYLRIYPAPFYIAAAVIAAAGAVLSWSGGRLPAGVSEWIVPVFTRGGLAGGFFVIVMVTGALPNGSAPMKVLMPIRGQLSILASILTLGHNAAYGKTYFTMLFTAPSRLPLNQLMAAICSVLMLLIMLPLFVTSFQTVRKGMNPKRWKRLQRLAYGFYGLLYCHILLLTVPRALNVDGAYRLTVFVYSAVFLGYGVCRVLKAAAVKRKTTGMLARRQIWGAVCCGMLSLAVVLCLPVGGETSITVRDAEVSPRVVVSESSDMGSILDGIVSVVEEEAFAGASGYRDGVFSGSAMGMNAKIEVSVTIQGGAITDITIDSSRDDEPYFTDALTVLDDMIEANSADVDAVSGATFSSGGIIDAVADALAQAGGGT